MTSGLAGWLEGVGATLVVLGLVFWSLPVALVTAGLFLVAVANAPAGRPLPTKPGRDGRRAEVTR